MTYAPGKRIEAIKTFISMRYGRNMNDCMDDMEFMINMIKKQDDEIQALQAKLEDTEQDTIFAGLYR
jgi:hypothetical protein